VHVRTAILLVVVAMLAGCESRESRYPSVEAARADGAMQRGWIPEFLPASAHDIRLSYDLDSNEIWLRFGYAPDSLAGMLVAFQKEDPAITDDYPRMPRRGRWRPESLTRENTTNSSATYDGVYWCDRTRYSITGRADRARGFLVVEPAKDTAYYWEYRE
jgi:hypothetical protein